MVIYLGSKKYSLLLIVPLIASVFDYSNLLNRSNNNMQIKSDYKEALIQLRVQTDSATFSLCNRLCQYFM